MLTAEQKNKITNWYNEHEEQLLSDISMLCSFDSQRRDPLPGMPFGREAADCLEAATKMMEGYGFTVTNYDNYILAADMGSRPAKLDILAHLDVVPVSKNWTVTDPFTCKIVDGRIYGRGTCDDKGPAMVTLYAMRAIKELGLSCPGGIRLLLGSDEECGSSDLRYYFQREKSAPYSFSPDAEFPLINIEKGRLSGGFSSSVETAEKLPRLLSVKSGMKLNVVPDEAQAVVEGLTVAEADEILADLTMYQKEEIHFTFTEMDGKLEIFAKGKSAHASTPQGGANALTALLTLLSALPLSDEKLHEQIRGISKLFPQGDFYGSNAGIEIEDRESGKSTFSLNLFSLEGNHMEGKIDGRLSLAASDENTTDVLDAKWNALGLTPLGEKMNPPHYVPKDSEIVTKLMSAWSEVTGKQAGPLAIGGGTYVHHIENGVAFGCGEIDQDTHMHGDDEFMEISQIRKSFEILVRAILNICG